MRYILTIISVDMGQPPQKIKYFEIQTHAKRKAEDIFFQSIGNILKILFQN